MIKIHNSSIISSFPWKERYKTSYCWFCSWCGWTWQPKFSPTKRKANWTVSSSFSGWTSKPLPWKSHCGSIGPTYKYCTGQILNALHAFVLWQLFLIFCNRVSIDTGYSTRTCICKEHWADCSSWWCFCSQWECESSSRGQRKLLYLCTYIYTHISDSKFSRLQLEFMHVTSFEFSLLSVQFLPTYWVYLLLWNTISSKSATTFSFFYCISARLIFWLGLFISRLNLSFGSFYGNIFKIYLNRCW